MADSRQILLDTFADNNAQQITAADLRQFVNSVYDEKVAITDIIDNLVTITTDQALSANQGKVLNDAILVLQGLIMTNVADITTNSNNIASLGGGIDTTFLTGSNTLVTVTNGIITNIEDVI